MEKRGGQPPSYGFWRMAFKSTIRALVLAMLVVAGPALADTYRIVGFGDSLMAGYQLGPDEGFTPKLQAALKARGHDVEVANAGVSGDTTSGGLARLDWSVPDGTDLVILELGANDMLRGLSPSITEQNLDRMLAGLKARGIPVVLAGMYAAPNLGEDYAKSFNAIYPALAQKYDAPLIGFFMEGVAANPALQLEDGLHPNPAGVDAMVKNALPVIEPLIK